MLPLEEVFGDRLNVTVLRLLSQVAGGMSGNGIARRLGIQQSAARKALERLVVRGVVTRADVGRTAAYALDLRREVVRRVVLAAFRAEAGLADRLRRTLQRAALALVPQPVAVVMYGSVAQGSSESGDIDLLVVLARAADEDPVRAALLDRMRRVEVRFQLAVHPVVLTRDELAARAGDPLIIAIAAEGILLSGTPPRPLRRIRRLPRPGPAPLASSIAAPGITPKPDADRSAPRRARRAPG